MKIATRLLGLVILLGLGWVAWRHFFPNEEHRIRRMLDGLAETVSIPAGESPVGTALALDKLLSCVTSTIEVDVDVPSEGKHTFSGRQEIRDAAMLAHQTLRGLKVQFLDVNVTLAAGKQTAAVELTVKATPPGAKEFFVEEMRLQLRKEDNQWRVSRAETVETLKL